LLKAFRSDGAAGLISKKRGRPSHRKTAAAVRTAVLWIVRHNYADFGPTLAAEKLAGEHGFGFSSETLRKWMIEDGLWINRKQRQKRVHQPRPRRDDATASANWYRLMAASTGGSKTAGRNAPCWCSSTTRPAGCCTSSLSRGSRLSPISTSPLKGRSAGLDAVDVGCRLRVRLDCVDTTNSRAYVSAEAISGAVNKVTLVE
jgi:hypothetical protein